MITDKDKMLACLVFLAKVGNWVGGVEPTNPFEIFRKRAFDVKHLWDTLSPNLFLFLTELKDEDIEAIVADYIFSENNQNEPFS